MLIFHFYNDISVYTHMSFRFWRFLSVSSFRSYSHLWSHDTKNFPSLANRWVFLYAIAFRCYLVNISISFYEYLIVKEFTKGLSQLRTSKQSKSEAHARWHHQNSQNGQKHQKTPKDEENTIPSILKNSAATSGKFTEYRIFTTYVCLQYGND